MADLKPPRPARALRARRAAATPPPKAAHEPLWTNGGRAWINGAEVGGADPRYAHLNRSYD